MESLVWSGCVDTDPAIITNIHINVYINLH